MSPCEVVWRIFAFDIHHKWPPIQRLMFHLPNQQPIYFKYEEEIDTVVIRKGELKTMFLAWFDANKSYVEGRDLTYSEFPTRFVYSLGMKKYDRLGRKASALEDLITFHPVLVSYIT